MRVDGTEVAPGLTQFFTSTTLESFVDQYADGSYVAPDGAELTWTGASDPMSLGTVSCTNWTSTQTTDTALAGSPISAQASQFWGDVVMSSFESLSCSTVEPVMCIEQ